MSDMKKCDRCKMVYEDDYSDWKGGLQKTVLGVPGQTYFIENPPLPTQIWQPGGDLCHGCRESLRQWWNHEGKIL